MKFLVTGICTLFIAFSATAQFDSSSYALLQFDTEAEKAAFDQIRTGKSPDYLIFYLSIGSKTSITKERCFGLMNNFFEDHPLKDLQSKSALKKLFKDAGDVFCKTLAGHGGTFQDVFEKGEYTHNTATAFFVWLFDQLKLEYSIRGDSVTYAKVKAGKNTVDFAFPVPKDVTQSVAGVGVGSVMVGVGTYYHAFINYREFKKPFTKYLSATKAYSSEGGKNVKEEVFNQFYYDTTSLNRNQLAGLLYWQLSIAGERKKDLTEAYKNCEKAYYLYPCHRTKFHLIGVLNKMIAKESEGKETDRSGANYQRLMQLGFTEKETAVEGE